MSTELITERIKCDDVIECPVMGCHQYRLPTTTFCKLHLCQFDRCPYQVETGKLACDEHICGKQDCIEARLIEAIYCLNHSCNDEDCLQMAMYDSRYCANHTCTQDNCYNRANGNECYLHEPPEIVNNKVNIEMEIIKGLLYGIGGIIIHKMICKSLF